MVGDSTVGMDLGGFGSGSGYGSLWLVRYGKFFILLGLWCNNGGGGW